MAFPTFHLNTIVPTHARSRQASCACCAWMNCCGRTAIRLRPMNNSLCRLAAQTVEPSTEVYADFDAAPERQSVSMHTCVCVHTYPARTPV